MAIAVDIDFSNTYEIDTISEDLKQGSFITILEDGTLTDLNIEISDESHELLPNVYNLAFGPATDRGIVDDKAELRHSNYSKVFSTILLYAFTYLNANKDHYIGIDGSDIARAYLYHRFIQRNYGYLTDLFNIFGLKYYVRITRFGKKQYQNPFDFDDIFAKAQKIERVSKVSIEALYNYYIFDLKK